MKNLLTQWETEEKNQMTGGNVLLIDKEHSGDMLLIDGKPSGDVLLIDRKLVELEDDAEYASLPKLTKLMKKPSNLTRTGKEKLETLDALNLLASGVTLRKSYQW